MVQVGSGIGETVMTFSTNSEGLVYEGPPWRFLSKEDRGQLLRDALAYGKKELELSLTMSDVAAGLNISPWVVCNLASQLKISFASSGQKRTISFTPAGRRLAAAYNEERGDYSEHEKPRGPNTSEASTQGRFVNRADIRYGK